MLPGPLLPPPPPELVVYPSVPSLPPSATPSSPSIGSSIAIVVLVVISTAVVTIAIVVFRRSYHRRRRLSFSSFSPRCSLSPRASSSSSSSTMSQMWRAAVAAVGSSPRASASSVRAWPEMAVASSAPGDAGKAPAMALTNSAQGAVQGAAGLMTPSATPAAAMVPPMLVPSAPSLPEVEQVIMDLISLQPSPSKTMMNNSTAACFFCKQVLLPTEVLLTLPVCSHMFHQRCIVGWLRSRVVMPLLRCPLCHDSMSIRCSNPAPTFCLDEYDIESQTLVAPAPPGEEVAEAVGGSRGWLRSSLDRLSDSWRACSGSRATAAVAPGSRSSSSRRTTGSWSLGSSGHLGADVSHGVLLQTQVKLPLPVLPADEEVAADAGGSRGWLRSSLATLSGRCTVFPTSCSAAMELPVSSYSSRRTTTGSLELSSRGDGGTGSWSRWDPEAAVSEPQERPSVLGYARWLFRNSG
ncbi:uncharacterized protein LOC102705915 [Oryza brachyantha]|nr:uncharacterized protein LOC102705915 [Oryza brachyantha]